MSEQIIKKILITGANGFIGGALMRHYQEKGQDVIGVDLIGNGADIVQGDIANPNSISHLLKECDVIIHTAALVSNALKDSDMWRVNVMATRNFIDAAKEYAKTTYSKIKRKLSLLSVQPSCVFTNCWPYLPFKVINQNLCYIVMLCLSCHTRYMLKVRIPPLYQNNHPWKGNNCHW